MHIYNFVSGKKNYLLSNLQQKGALCHITPYSCKKSAAMLKLFRVKRCYLTNNTVCIYQNDYNNTVFDDKRYHLTDSTFLFVLKTMLFVK